MFRCKSDRARYASLALLLLLNVLFVTTGLATAFTRNEYLERSPRKSFVPEGELRVSASAAHSEIHLKLKDSDFGKGTVHADAGVEVVPEFLDAVTGRTQFHGTTNSPESEDEKGSSWREAGKIYGRNRRFLRGAGVPGRRPRPLGWFLRQREGRSMIEGSNTTTAATSQTQPFYLGPPAPPGIVHNEKQDWSQDYAEPDVHPPSSN